MVCTDILLPPQAPAEYQDRATLWNAVEKAERGKKSQLAYSFDIALTVSAPMRFCNFSPNRDCKKVAGRGVQPLNNYTCRFRPSSLKCTDKSGLDGLQADKWAGN